VALDTDLPAVAGEIGRDEQRLAAAGRDRHETIEHDVVADRPGSEHDRERSDEQRGGGDAEAHAPPAPGPHEHQ
jgi:hypothetical protein